MVQRQRSLAGGERCPRARADRGASLLEAAMCLPVLFLLFFGMVEIGVALKTYSSAADAVRSGGRMAAVAGSDPLADQATLLRIAEESAGVSRDQIDMVVIWHAPGPGTGIPPGCLPAVPELPNTISVGISDGGVDALGACNVYQRPGMPGGAFDMARGNLVHPPSYYFGCQGVSDPLASQKVDCRWPGKNRRDEGTPRTASVAKPPDFVGVYIQIDHDVLTRHLGGTVTIKDSTINLIEPEGYDLT